MSHLTPTDNRRLADLTPNSHPSAERIKGRALVDEMHRHEALHHDSIEPADDEDDEGPDYGGTLDHVDDDSGSEEFDDARRALRAHNRKIAAKKD